MPPIYLQRNFLLCTEVNVVWRVQLSFENDKGGIPALVSSQFFCITTILKEKKQKQQKR